MRLTAAAGMQKFKWRGLWSARDPTSRDQTAVLACRVPRGRNRNARPARRESSRATRVGQRITAGRGIDFERVKSTRNGLRRLTRETREELRSDGGLTGTP